MGTKKPPYKCEEYHVGEGKVTGLSGDVCVCEYGLKHKAFRIKVYY